MMTYEVRFPTHSETPAIVRFISSTWGRNHILAKDMDLLQWQLSWHHSQKMRGSGVSALTVWNGDEIVGMQGLIHAPFRIGTERLTSVWLCNLMVAEQHRPCGVGARLMTSVHNLPVDVIATSGINLDILPLYRKMRYHIIDSLDRYIHVNDAKQFDALTGCQGSGDQIARSAHTSFSTLNLTHDDDFDEFWPIFSDRSLRANHVGIDRTREYMRWRYVQHPRFSYKIVTARDGDNFILGVIIFRIEQISGFDGKVMRVLEIDAIDDTIFSFMLGEAGEISRQYGVIFSDYYSSIDISAIIADGGWAPSSRFSKAIPAYFQPLDYRAQQVSVAARTLKPGFLPRDWDGLLNVAKSDGDQDRPNLTEQ
jgi:hypothetical protein